MRKGGRLKTMRILIIINTLRYGGAEKQSVIDANSLARAGHRVTIGFHEKGDLVKWLSPDVRQLNIGCKNLICAAVLLFHHLLLNRYDVIHSHMFWAERVSILPGKLTGHRVVFNEHGLGLWRRWYHILTMRFISMLADRVITSCRENYRIRAEREKLNPRKIVVIYNSVEEYEKTVTASILAPEAHAGKFVIGYIGRFSAVKRLEIFLDIAERLKGKIDNFKIVLVGDGEVRGRLQQEIVDRKLENFFHMPGFAFVVSPYYETFDVFVLPSRVEGFSVALLEAGAAGVPSIAFDVGGNSEIILDGISGYIIPNNDLGELLSKIIYLYEHHDIGKNIGEAARRLIRKKFSTACRLDSLQKLYWSLE